MMEEVSTLGSLPMSPVYESRISSHPPTLEVVVNAMIDYESGPSLKDQGKTRRKE